MINTNKVAYMKLKFRLQPTSLKNSQTFSQIKTVLNAAA